MNRENKIIVSVFIVVCLLIVSLGGYWVLNKEQIKLVVKGKETEISTFKTTVKELLDEAGIEYDKDDRIEPSLSTEVVDYMKINVTKVEKKQVVEYEEIPYEVKLIEDKELLKGKTKIEQEGISGKKELKYDLTYEDGVLVKKALSKEAVSKEPTNKIVKKGIKEEIIVASRESTSRASNQINNSNNTSQVSGNASQASGKSMSVVATAYSCGTITSTGTSPRWGVIAVDPRVIPYGTRVYIPQFNMTFVAEDCGGAIKGNKIDIFMGSEAQCRSWGRRTIDIQIVR